MYGLSYGIMFIYLINNIIDLVIGIIIERDVVKSPNLALEAMDSTMWTSNNTKKVSHINMKFSYFNMF